MFRVSFRTHLFTQTIRLFSNTTKFKPVTHVIFDMDGTLLDTEKIYFDLFHIIAKKHGKVFTDDIRQQLLGRNMVQTADTFINGLQLNITPEEFENEVQRMGMERLENVELKPGAQKLMCHFSKHKIPMALATSSPDNFVELKIRKNHRPLFQLFHHMVCGSTDPEVKNGKPAPDIFLIAAKRFAEPANPECCIVFEDSPSGILGAHCAGMQTILVPEIELPAEIYETATMCIKSLEDFDPTLFGLPAFSD